MITLDKNKKRIFAISGSTRKKSTNESILRTIAALYKESLEVQIYLDIGELPHFNPDLDNEKVHPTVKRFRRMIEKSDGVIICTPEYVFSLPGTLKNAFDWTVSTTVFTNKPVAMIVASTGGAKAFESLELILNTLGAKVTEQSKLLLQGIRSKIGDKGELSDQNTIDKLKITVDSLIALIN